MYVVQATPSSGWAKSIAESILDTVESTVALFVLVQIQQNFNVNTNFNNGVIRRMEIELGRLAASLSVFYIWMTCRCDIYLFPRMVLWRSDWITFI